MSNTNIAAGFCLFGLFAVADAMNCIRLGHDDWFVPFTCAVISLIGAYRTPLTQGD